MWIWGEIPELNRCVGDYELRHSGFFMDLAMRFVQREFEIYANNRDCVIICQGDQTIELSPFQCEAVAAAVHHLSRVILSSYDLSADPAVEHAAQFDGDEKAGA